VSRTEWDWPCHGMASPTTPPKLPRSLPP
jgi:hypothetical protein